MTRWSGTELLPLMIAELQTVRARSGARPGADETPVLHEAASAWGARQDRPRTDPGEALESLLRVAVGELAGARLRSAAEYTFGLVPGTRHWPTANRRRLAAAAFECSGERFRKYHERVVVEQTAEAVYALCARFPAPRVVPVAFAHGATAVTVHTGPIELLSGIDVLVSSENTYFEMAPPFRASTSAGLRRAGAVRGADGAVLDDVVARELRAWMDDHAAPGLPVAPGTVAATSPGRLAERGVRRLYHAAVATPRLDGAGYRVTADVVTAAVHRVFAQARIERDSFAPPLSSVCLPLLGAGRGGLDPLVSARALIGAVESALLRDAAWTVHVVALGRPLAAMVGAELRAVGGTPS